MSDAFTKSAAAAAEVWAAPDMGNASVVQKVPTVRALADLQAEAYKEAFELGIAEGREAGRGQVRAQVEQLAGMFYDLAKPFEELDAEVERELLTLAMALARQIVRRELKTDPKTIGIPVVVMTSSNQDRDVTESYQLGVNGYVTKPVQVGSFMEAVAEIGMYWLLTNQAPAR